MENPESLEKIAERALGALRFSPNAKLKIMPFQAHHAIPGTSRHSRHITANTVIRNLTKKPSLRNLNWSSVLKSKSAYLDEQYAEAQKMPKRGHSLGHAIG